MSSPDLPNIGYIYIMSNPLFTNDVRKIGCTFGSKSPFLRADELYTTGVPGEFTVERCFFVEDCELVEQIAHMRLKHKSTNSEREFFRVSLEEATETIQQSQRDVQQKIWSNDYIPNITHKSIGGLKENLKSSQESTPSIKNYKDSNSQNSNNNSFEKREYKAKESTSKPVSTSEQLSQKKSVPYVMGNDSYNNPKFPKLLLLLAKGSAAKRLNSFETLAEKLEISVQGVEKLITLCKELEKKHQVKLLFEGDKVKYKNYLGINIQIKKSISLLKDLFPRCDFSELQTFFIESENNPEPKRAPSSYIPRETPKIAQETDIFSTLNALSQSENTSNRRPKP